MFTEFVNLIEELSNNDFNHMLDPPAFTTVCMSHSLSSKKTMAHTLDVISENLNI